MTSSESAWRRRYLKMRPGAYVKKLPDFKSSGSVQGGLPDYISIVKGITVWYEVKTSDTHTLRLSHFTSQQVIEFTKMLKVGAVIVCSVLTPSGWVDVDLRLHWPRLVAGMSVKLVRSTGGKPR